MPPAPPSLTQGFSFQLNCYSPKPASPTPGYPAWQQYIISLLGTQLNGAVNSYNESGSGVSGVPNQLLGPSLPHVAIPKGYILNITLNSDPSDPSGAINSVTWFVNGVRYNAPIFNPTPIVAFTLNLVGPIGGESAVLSSGAGIITYSAATPLTVTNAEPTKCADFRGYTCERATSSYGELPANPPTPFTQTFAASATTPLIHRVREIPLARR
jgi:hypothetical protein